MKLAAATLMLLLVATGANAQAVYRCGSVYSQTPCPDGKIVEATDPRSAAQQAEARRVADDERRLAAEMRRERLAEQAAVRPAAASSLSGPLPAQPASGAARREKKRVSATAEAPAVFIAGDSKPRLRPGQK